MSSLSIGASRTDKHIAVVSSMLLILYSGATLRAEPCGLAVRLSGDPELTKHIGDGLIAQGISLDSQDDCTATRVSLSTGREGILIRIVTVNGQRMQQAVATPPAAVSLIESWVRQKLTDSLLNPSERAPKTPDKVVSEEGGAATDAKTDGVSKPDAKTAIGLRSNFEFSVGRDGSIWLGGRLMGCVSIGRVCVGLAGRFSGDLGATGDAAYFLARRKSLDALATIEIPFKLRRLSLIPGIALGGGWVFIHRLVSAFESRAPDGKERKLRANTAGFRVEASLTTAYELKKRLYLDTGLSFDILFFSRQDIMIKTIDIDNVAATYNSWFIPGAPFFYIRIGLGLRYVF